MEAIGIREEILKHRIEARRIKKALKDKISSLPDNSEITRINKQCFTINLSTIRKNNLILCPLYYDFKAQYRMIIERIDNTEFKNVAQTLFNIIRERKIIKNNCTRGFTFPVTYKLHPEVVEYLKEVID